MHVWESSTPEASHMGGVWEIRSVRTVLPGILKEHSLILNYTEL